MTEASRFKFRVWLPEGMRYLPPEWVATGRKYMLLTGSDEKCRVYARYENKKGGLWELEEPHVREQSTGLTDANDVEIFEGDIVEHTERGSTYRDPVHWNGDQWKVGKWEPCGLSWCAADKDSRVVGNIHENPELLEEGARNG